MISEPSYSWSASSLTVYRINYIYSYAYSSINGIAESHLGHKKITWGLLSVKYKKCPACSLKIKLLLLIFVRKKNWFSGCLHKNSLPSLLYLLHPLQILLSTSKECCEDNSCLTWRGRSPWERWRWLVQLLLAQMSRFTPSSRSVLKDLNSKRIHKLLVTRVKRTACFWYT